MTTTTFDTLGYYEKLKAAGFTEAQAKVQVEAMQGVVKSYDEASRKELATKGDIQDIRLEIEKVKASIKDTELRLLKWQLGIGLALAVIIGQGFWLAGILVQEQNCDIGERRFGDGSSFLFWGVCGY